MAKTMRQKVGGFQVLSSWGVGHPWHLRPTVALGENLSGYTRTTRPLTESL